MKPVLFLCALSLAANLACAQTVLNPADLESWKLTLPLDEDGDGIADTVKDVRGFSRSPWFVPGEQGIVLRANAGGARTSSKTAYPRSELREMAFDGSPAAWDCLGATRRMRLEQALLRTTVAKPQVTLGQIHDTDQDNLMIRYTGPSGADGISDTGRLEVILNDGRQKMALDPAYQLGDMMQLSIAADHGRVKLDYLNQRSGFEKRLEGQLDPAHIKGGCYFKAGLYIQACSRIDSQGKPNANCVKKGWRAEKYDMPDAYAEVLIRQLRLE